jgi:ketopantoate reductase
VPVRAVTDWSAAPAPDVVVLAVKNYDLAAAAAEIRAHLTHDPIVVALQNGVANQRVLPGHFRHVVYGVVCCNAWREAPNVFGYESVGPVVLGVLDPAQAAHRDRVVASFGSALQCRAESRATTARFTRSRASGSASRTRSRSTKPNSGGDSRAADPVVSVRFVSDLSRP